VKLRALAAGTLRGKGNGLTIGAGVGLVIAAGLICELADVRPICGDGVDVGIAIAFGIEYEPLGGVTVRSACGG